MNKNRFHPQLEELGERIAPSVTPLTPPSDAHVAAQVSDFHHDMQVILQEEAPPADEHHGHHEHEETTPSYEAEAHGSMIDVHFEHLPEGSKLVVATDAGSYTLPLKEGECECTIPGSMNTHAWLIAGELRIELDLSEALHEIAVEKAHEVEHEFYEAVEAYAHQLHMNHLRHESEEKMLEGIEEAIEHAHHMHQHGHHEHAHEHVHEHEHEHPHHHEHEEHEGHESLTELEEETDELIRELRALANGHGHGNGHGNGHGPHGRQEIARRLRRQAHHELHAIEHRQHETSPRIEPTHWRWLEQRHQYLERVVHNLPQEEHGPEVAPAPHPAPVPHGQE